MTDMNIKISDLKLKPELTIELSQLGYETVGDTQHMSRGEILRIPGMGGVSYRRLMVAMGLDPYSTPRRPRGMRNPKPETAGTEN